MSSEVSKAFFELSVFRSPRTSQGGSTNTKITFPLISSWSPSSLSSTEHLRAIILTQQRGAFASSILFITVDPSSLRVEEAAGLNSSTMFSSLVVTALSDDAASSMSVVFLLRYQLVWEAIVILLLGLNRFKPRLAAVEAVEYISSNRLVYDAVTTGWDFGLITTFLPSSSSFTSSWIGGGRVFQSFSNRLGKRCKNKRKSSLCRRNFSSSYYSLCTVQRESFKASLLRFPNMKQQRKLAPLSNSGDQYLAIRCTPSGLRRGVPESKGVSDSFTDTNPSACCDKTWSWVTKGMNYI